LSPQNIIQPTVEQLESVFLLHKEAPDMTASRVLTGSQKIFLFLMCAALAAGLALRPIGTLLVINGLFLSFYLVLSAYKIFLIDASLRHDQDLDFSEDEIRSLKDEDLPIYTVLVPLYHEAETLSRLVDGLSRLDYPKDKLDVILLLEEDDTETREAASRMDMPDFIRQLVVPHGQPKTKPKACNLGLACARGEYLVIYDAEDRPQPDQLKKAVLGFRKSPPEVVCIQAKLNFYNQKFNLLTHWFTMDYSVWFDLYLPALDRLSAPIPLGGTSNHFITQKLRDVRGWDPYNVTEDADLGIRLASNGFITRTLNSTTWEEACSHLGFWIRQRSRWTKGYIQTYLVHMRHWHRLLSNVGLWKWLSFQLIVGGTPLCLLINPIYWLLTIIWFTLRWESVSLLFPFPVILFGLLCLFVGNFVFIYSSMLACYRRGYYHVVRYGLILPVYWIAMSVGAWKGFLQLITRPSYWEKTKHGFDLPASSTESIQHAAEGT